MIIKRARGFRLYTVDGKKILDLSMDCGRGVLGHRPNGLSLAIKNVIDRGLYAGYSNIYEHRLRKELKSRFKDYEYITFLEHEVFVSDYFNRSIADPLFDDLTDSCVAYWRPFLDLPPADNIVVLYPLPGLNSTTILLSKKKPNLTSCSVSAVLLAGILRSMYDYDQELETFDPESYSIYSTIPNTVLKAPYLIFNSSEDEYQRLVDRAMSNGIMLNDRKNMAVLSTDLSRGETEKIINTLS